MYFVKFTPGGQEKPAAFCRMRGLHNEFFENFEEDL
jgi:hypothetical protein